MITQSSFLAFYPQFSSFTPGVVLTEYLSQANARFSDFDSDADEARRLYVAHKLTLYAASCLPEGTGPAHWSGKNFPFQNAVQTDFQSH